MFKNYLKIALRNLRKHKGFTFVNLAGLALGITCCLLIILYVQYEMSYDRFHEGADRIYRIAWRSDNPQTRTPHPMALAAVKEIPDVESAVSLTPIWGPGLTRPTFSVRYQDQKYEEGGFLAVDSTFLDVFTFPVVRGDGPAALRKPFSILITESMARKYFGSEDPIGKTLRINEEGDMTVAAVLKDVPSNAHFHFDFLLSYVTLKVLWNGGDFFAWDDFGHYNYLRLTEGADPARVQAALYPLISRHLQIPQEIKSSLDRGLIGFELQPLTSIHLRSNLRWELEPTGNFAFLVTLSFAALFILLIACFNFMNLSVARAMKRAREFGLRKTLGAIRHQLVEQMLGESILLSLLAMILALALITLVMPAFNAFAGTQLSVTTIGIARLLLMLVGIALVVGILVGSYPALYLSSFQPLQVLKGTFKTGRRSLFVRKGLVVFQFALSILLLAGTGIVFRQEGYMRDKWLGFDRNNVLVVPMKEGGMANEAETIRQELLKIPGVIDASAVSNVPGGNFNQNAVHWRADRDDVDMSELRVDFDFIKTMDIEIAQGRGFSRDFPGDVEKSFIINEAAARQFDWDTPVGKELDWLDENGARHGTVVGVVKDFHFQSLHQTVGPLIMQILPGSAGYMLVRVDPDRLSELLPHLEKTWTTFSPARGFEYSFLDQNLALLYCTEERLGWIFGTFALLAILVACLGLFAMVSFTTEQRTKEIGVRKVLGSSVPGIVLLLSREFAVLVITAAILAIPVAYLAMSRWLEHFAYRTSMPVFVFVLAGALALAVAMLTVSLHTVRAASVNPVKSLRYE